MTASSRNARRVTPAAVAALVLLAACGGDSATRLTLGASASESRSANSGAALADSKMAVWAPVVTYVAGDELSDPKWTDGVGRRSAWRYDAPKAPGRELARIASVLGVKGDVKEDAANKGYWTTSTEPGAPNFSSWGDEHGRWWSYSSVVASSKSSSGSAATEPCPPDSKDCAPRPVDTVPPAENLPTKEEARTLATALLRRIGVDTTPSALTLDVYADDWSVRVSAAAVHEGETSWVRSWNVGYGSDARLTDASGSLARLEKADSYPVIDPIAAVKRLNDGLGLTGVVGWGAVARDTAVDSMAPSTEGTVPPPTEVRLVSARISLVDWTLADGTPMLLPAWALADSEGNEVKVVAVTDDYISWPQVDPIPGDPGAVEPEPGTVEPVPGNTGGGSTGSSGGGSAGTPGDSGGSDDVPATAIRDEDAQKLLGLTEEEATKVAVGNGWAVRVAERDGESFMLTTDYRNDRVNLTVKDGKVTSVTVG